MKNPEYEIPKGRKSGGFVVLDQAALAKATKSTALNKFVTLGSEALHLASNRSKPLCRNTCSRMPCLTTVIAALPLYNPRQSVKDLKKAGADKKLLAKTSSTKPPTSAGAKTARREVSDTESYDSSDDDSEYTDDEDSESPLPAIRPDEPHEAVRYDIIKATWYPRTSQPSSEKIKSSLRDAWEVLNTIQKRWRNDSKAVAEAEEQKKVGELPVLKSRVTSQRDLLQSALKSALEYAHPDVLYHFGQVKQFLYLCYLFLANRVKMKDFDGPLPSVILQILARCAGTSTTEALEDTKVIKALNAMKKNVNDKNKALIQQIIDGAAAGSKKAKVSSPPEIEVTGESRSVKRPATQAANRPTSDGPAAKKLKPTETTTNGEKKPATTTSAPKTAVPAGMAQKRPGEKPSPTAAKARGNQVVNKPSTLFASLNAASKKPGTGATSASTAKMTTKTAVAAAKEKKSAPAAPAKPAFSFAETMAQLLKPKEEEPAAPTKTEKQLPPETPEEKARRLRKESRRHLRVAFRPDASLVSIRYFNHDPNEESGHDENFLRDAGDIGGEGRMFRQHKDLVDDEDDDDLEVEYRPWKEPTLVDFSTVDAEERKRNYEPYGGGECKPSCPEKEANARHENSTLMVFYTHPSDIPSSPREPLEQQTQSSTSAPVTNFGLPPELVRSRAPKGATPTPTPDFSSLENIFKQFSVPTTNPASTTASQNTYVASAVTAPSVPAVPDLASILSALNGQAQAQAPAQVPAPFPSAQQPAAAAPALDFNAIMSAIQGNTALPQPPPPPGWPVFPPVFPQPQQDGGVAYQAQPQPQHNQHGHGGHKRQRDDGNGHEDRGSKRHRGGAGGGGKPHKVIPCRFFQKGMCNKGDECTYIHDVNM